MGRIKIFILILIPIVLWTDQVYAQQVPQFSQYMFNPLFLNPAYAGYKESMYIQSYYRKQWAGIEGSPETFVVSADGKIENKKLGLGGHVVMDRIGAQRTTGAYANLSYHLQLAEEHFLSFGFGAGLVNSMLDGGLLNSGDPNDPAVPAGRDQLLYPDLKLGLYYYTPRFFVGVSMDNIFSSQMGLGDQAIIIEPVSNFYFTAGTLIEISPNLAFKPTLLYMDDFNAPARMDFSSFLLFYEKFWLGLSYRTSMNLSNRGFDDNLQRPTALVGLIEFYVNERFRIGYAYDHNLTGFGRTNVSTHDLSVGFILPPKKVQIVSPRYF